MKKISYFLLAFILILQSFQIKNNFENNIIGTWVPREGRDHETFYHRSQKFLTDLPGFRFMEDGKLVVRMNNNGRIQEREPVIFENYEGTWNQIDSTLILKYNSPHGYIKEAWEISGLDSIKLTINLYGRLSTVKGLKLD
jgi:hypothetical protein